MSETPIGLIAGWGSFPIEVAAALKAAGHPVYCVAITDHASAKLESICDAVLWTGVGKLGRYIRFFRRHRVRQVTMAGKLFKADLLYSGSLWRRHLPDLTCIRTFGPLLLGRRRDARDDNLLLAVIGAFQRYQLTVCAATDFAPELLVQSGQLTDTALTPLQHSDVAAGWRIARLMGAADIGQSVTVKDGTIIAVEAIEGTDAAIERTGRLCRRGGWTLVKVSKPNQDMRFDVPTIGPQTVTKVRDHGGRVIAIEADKTIVVQRAETLRLARQAGITIMALTDSEIGDTATGADVRFAA